MTDRRIKEPCPFCWTSEKEIQIITYIEGVNIIRCPNCGVTFEGFWSKQEIIDRWNGRYR